MKIFTYLIAYLDFYFKYILAKIQLIYHVATFYAPHFMI